MVTASRLGLPISTAATGPSPDRGLRLIKRGLYRESSVLDIRSSSPRIDGDQGSAGPTIGSRVATATRNVSAERHMFPLPEQNRENCNLQPRQTVTFPATSCGIARVCFLHQGLAAVFGFREASSGPEKSVRRRRWRPASGMERGVDR